MILRATYGLCMFILFYIGKVNCVLVQQNVALFANKSDSAEIKCSHNDSSMLNMLWYQQKDTAAMALIGYKYASGDPSYETAFEGRFELEKTDTHNGTLKISELSQSDSAVYYCAVRRTNNANPAIFGNGTKLTVLDPLIPKSEPSVKILNAPQKESCKKKVTLVCWAEDFYPDHVKVAWFVGQQEITEDVATDPHATFVEGKKYTISSRLKVSQKMWKKSTNKFTCIVSYYNGSVTTEQSASVYGVAGGYDRDSYVKSSQWMKLAYGVTIAKSGLYGLVIFVFVWRKGSNEK